LCQLSRRYRAPAPRANYLGHQRAYTLYQARFGEAEKVRSPANDDSMLRWNRCARLLEKFPHVEQKEEAAFFDDDETAPLQAVRMAR